VSDALIKSLSKKDKIAIARLVAREGGAVRMVALLPQEEMVDPDDGQITPPGFHIIFLPFAEDLWDVEEDKNAALALKPKQVSSEQM